MASKRYSISKTFKKRRSDQSSIDHHWSAFDELYETSEAAKERRRSMESAKVEITDNESPKRTRKVRSNDWISTDELRRTKDYVDVVINDGEMTPPKIDHNKMDARSIDDFASPDSKPMDGSIDISPLPLSQMDVVSNAVIPKFESRPRPSPMNRPVEPKCDRHKTFPKGGLANRLSNLLKKQQSDLSLWNHRTKVGTQFGNCAMEVVLVKELRRDSISSMYRCRNVVTESEITDLIVIFRESIVREYSLEEGKRVKIFAPFLKLLADKFTVPVIVGPMFLQD